MARPSELLRNNKELVEQAIELHATTELSIKEIADRLGVDYQQLFRILRKAKGNTNISETINQIEIKSTKEEFSPNRIEIITNTSVPKVIEKNLQLQNLSLSKSIDATQMLITKIQELESFITELKNPDGTISNTRYREFLVAWKQMTDTLQWITDRRIKLQEALENQSFREAILECIKKEEPRVAMKIKEIIDRKREEFGLV